MSWTLIREVSSDSNAYDRYWDAEHGAAVVYRQGRSLFGFANGKSWGPIAIPDGSNTQAVRIRPENGQWYVYAYCDPRDGVRAEYKMAVAGL